MLEKAAPRGCSSKVSSSSELRHGACALKILNIKSLALARGHQPDLIFTILISHRLGTTESLKQHCLLSGGEVPGWFLYGSANTQNHACAKTTLPAERRRGSWMVPGWFLDGSANKSNHACAKTALLAGRRRDSRMVPGWFLCGSANTLDPRMCKNNIAC